MFFFSYIICPGLKCLPRQKRRILRLQRPDELSAKWLSHLFVTPLSMIL